MPRYIYKTEHRQKQIRLRVAASLVDFLGLLGSVALIVVCVVLLSSLASWIKGDFNSTFAVIEASVWDAVMVGFK